PLQFFALATLVGIPLYRLFKRCFWAHPFDNIPGPRATSWVKEIFGTEGWDFHAMMGHNYGPTSSFHSLLGVKISLSSKDKFLLSIFCYTGKAIIYIRSKGRASYLRQGLMIRATTNQLCFSTYIRRILNPAFSPAHLKDLTPVFSEVGHRQSQKWPSRSIPLYRTIYLP
ncbi:hypothetical protein MPER_10981, partial [Moniliophthora perniciosa FA553]